MPRIELVFIGVCLVAVLVLILLMVIAVHSKVEEAHRGAKAHSEYCRAAMNLLEARMNRQDIYLTLLLKDAVVNDKNESGPLN